MADRSTGPGRLRRLASGWSVRAFLGLIALTALVLGWFELRVGPQRRAVRTILRSGGSVYYDWQYHEDKLGQVDLRGEPRVPAWLMTAFGPDAFGDVSAVLLSNQEIAGDRLDAIRRLTGLRDLDLSNVRIGPEGLAAIAELPRLTRLSLAHGDVDDDGLARLSRLTGLKVLDLSLTRVGDAGLAHLAGMTNLKFLFLSWTNVGDDGLQSLAGLGQLDILELQGTRVSDAGLGSLLGLGRLVKLSLNGTRVSDAGLGTLARVPRLAILSLSDSGPGPHPTRAGVDALRRARPGMQVDFRETAPSSPGRSMNGSERIESPQPTAE